MNNIILSDGQKFTIKNDKGDLIINDNIRVIPPDGINVYDEDVMEIYDEKIDEGYTEDESMFFTSLIDELDNRIDFCRIQDNDMMYQVCIETWRGKIYSLPFIVSQNEI